MIVVLAYTLTYKRLIVRKHGGLDVLEIAENALRLLGKGVAHLRVVAVSVSRPDVSVRRGYTEVL